MNEPTRNDIPDDGDGLPKEEPVHVERLQRDRSAKVRQIFPWLAPPPDDTSTKEP